MGLMFFQQTTGINVFLTYKVKVEDEIGSAAFMQFAHVIACVFGAFFIERIGRRMMWAVSLLICALANALYAGIENGKWKTGFVFLFLFGYGIGGGPIPWFFVPELLEKEIRAQGAAVIAIVNWAFAFAVICLRMRFREELLKWQAAVVFAVCSFVGALLGVFLVRNTDDQSRRLQVLYNEADLYDGVN
jgi:MFS family permease